MLFLSGATFPSELFTPVFRIISKFVPATYYVEGIKDIISNKDLDPTYAGALLLTTVVGFVVGLKLFRWEKEEKIKGSAKMWVAAVLAPFLILGIWQIFFGKDVQASPMKRPRSSIDVNSSLHIVSDSRPGMTRPSSAR
jgi:hypothetical protein